jgi:hypothetical protein
MRTSREQVWWADSGASGELPSCANLLEQPAPVEVLRVVAGACKSHLVGEQELLDGVGVASGLDASLEQADRHVAGGVSLVGEHVGHRNTSRSISALPGLAASLFVSWAVMSPG